MIRFGKSASGLLAHKQDFFRENGALLEEGRRIAAIYCEQPRRTVCKCCGAGLGPPLFSKQGIDYVLCDNCGHLNGAHEDTDVFCASVYTGSGGADYAKTYSAADREAYRKRVRDIYLPKAEFLSDALNGLGCVPADLAYADFGAGSGYFVAAMRELGWRGAIGYEVSEVQAQLANSMIGGEAVQRHELDEVTALARRIDADVVSMVGVLEHLQAPRSMLGALRDNPRVRYLYISVPLFSPCVFFEMVFPDVFQRQLSAGHTHLFTESSLDWMCRDFGLQRMAEWWFGTDMVDLYRAISVELERRAELRSAAQCWSRLFAPAIDDLQLALDRRKLASEVHMLLRFDS